MTGPFRPLEELGVDELAELYEAAKAELHQFPFTCSVRLRHALDALRQPEVPS